MFGCFSFIFTVVAQTVLSRVIVAVLERVIDLLNAGAKKRK
jgi:hypothetical protein